MVLSGWTICICICFVFVFVFACVFVDVSRMFIFQWYCAREWFYLVGPFVFVFVLYLYLYLHVYLLMSAECLFSNGIVRVSGSIRSEHKTAALNSNNLLIAIVKLAVLISDKLGF